MNTLEKEIRSEDKNEEMIHREEEMEWMGL